MPTTASAMRSAAARRTRYSVEPCSRSLMAALRCCRIKSCMPALLCQYHSLHCSFLACFYAVKVNAACKVGCVKRDCVLPRLLHAVYRRCYFLPQYIVECQEHFFVFWNAVRDDGG